MSSWPDDVHNLARTVVELCKRSGHMVATAESCTGGMIGGALTEIAGSSQVVDRGFITYSNEAKMDMLGVQAATLQQYGAVSRETALQMARGALMRSNASLAVAVTGIAGPGGATPGKPVGLVHLAAMRPDGSLLHREMYYGDVGRERVRLATVMTALQLLAELSSA